MTHAFLWTVWIVRVVAAAANATDALADARRKTSSETTKKPKGQLLTRRLMPHGSGEMPDRIEEIKKRCEAFKHWHKVADRMVDYADSTGPDVEFLLSELAKLQAENATLRRQVEAVTQAIQDHAESGNIENYPYLSDKIEAIGKEGGGE